MIKMFCTANQHALPPIVSLPACPLRSVFIADLTLFRDVKGNITPPGQHFDDLLCLRGASYRAQVLASFVDDVVEVDVADYCDDDDGEIKMPVIHAHSTNHYLPVTNQHDHVVNTAINPLFADDSESDEDERTGIYSIYVQEPLEVRFVVTSTSTFCCSCAPN